MFQNINFDPDIIEFMPECIKNFFINKNKYLFMKPVALAGLVLAFFKSRTRNMRAMSKMFAVVFSRKVLMYRYAQPIVDRATERAFSFIRDLCQGLRDSCIFYFTNSQFSTLPQYQSLPARQLSCLRSRVFCGGMPASSRILRSQHHQRCCQG